MSPMALAAKRPISEPWNGPDSATLRSATVVRDGSAGASLALRFLLSRQVAGIIGRVQLHQYSVWIKELEAVFCDVGL